MRFLPKKNRSFAGILDSDMSVWFSLTRDEIHKLYRHWRMPASFTHANCQRSTGEEVFIVSMYHLLKGETYTSMDRGVFGGDPRQFSYMFKAFV